jgi:hypothetical protein
MAVRVKKEGGKLFFAFEDNYPVDKYRCRFTQTKWCIEQADKIYKWNDFPEISASVRDFENTQEEYTYSKRDTFIRLIPCFSFHAWPEIGIDDYMKTVGQISEEGLKPFEVNKVGWIGNAGNIPVRDMMCEIGSRNTHLFDIINMKYYGFKDGDPSRWSATVFLSIPELAKKYSILIDAEGGGYSARTKFLLWSHRPLILIDRPHKEYFYEFLEEWKHYIPVKRDLTDLVEKAQWCVDNYDKALQIAENAYQFSQTYLTRDACFAQWDKTIKYHLNDV